MKLKKYNPAFLTENELVEGFVVRHEQLAILLEILRENTGAANQHAIVIAPRGFGKSTLVLRAAVEVRRDPELRARLFPVVFPEESYQVGTVGELWLEALLQLSSASGEAHLRTAWEQLRGDRDEQRLAARALGALLDFADARGVRLLLVIENLDQLLDGQLSRDDAWTLRKTLLNERRIMVLATAVHRFEGLEQPDQAMFDLFRRLEMDPLSPRECDRVWGLVTGARIGTRRAKAVRILTGGNPRLVVMLSGFAQRRDLSGLLEELDGLIDENSDYFRQNIESLTGQLRRVFLALAELWRPASARAVAEAARLGVNETSAALSRLGAQGRVEVARTVGKNHLYQVTERLYNIYYLMRRRGGLEARVRALMDFLLTLFEPEQRTQLLEGIALDACGMEEGARSEHLALVHQLLEDRGRGDPEVFQRLILALPGPILKAPDLPEGAKALLKTPGALVAALGREDGGEFLEEAFTVLREETRAYLDPRALHRPGPVANPALAELARLIGVHADATPRQQLVAGSASLFLKDAPTAEASLRRAIAEMPQLKESYLLLATSLLALDRTQEAITVLEDALRVAPQEKDLNFERLLGLLLSDSTNRATLERALKLLQGAQRPGSVDLDVLDRICAVLGALGRQTEAEQTLLSAMEEIGKMPDRDKAPADHLASTGLILALRAKTHADALRIVASLTTAFPMASKGWSSLGRIHLLGGGMEQALAAAKRALRLSKKNVDALVLCAVCSLALGQPSKAQRYAEDATLRDPSQAAAWGVLVRVALQQRPEEVGAVVERAVERADGNAEVYQLIAIILFRTAPTEWWVEALNLMEHAEGAPEFPGLTLCLLGAVRGPEAAVSFLSSRLASGPSSAFFLKNLQRAAMRIAASGTVAPLVDVLQSSPRAGEVEPLLAALRLRLGEVVDAPVEILEVAEEVNKRIDALAATGDIWRTDPLAITLPDEQDPPTDEQAISQ